MNHVGADEVVSRDLAARVDTIGKRVTSACAEGSNGSVGSANKALKARASGTARETRDLTARVEAELYSVFAWRQAKQDSANSLGSSALPLLRHLNCARRNGVQWKRRSKKSYRPAQNENF